jgi:hypothetical protein
MNSRIANCIALVAIAVATTAAAACSQSAVHTPSTAERTGSAGLMLSLPGGAKINTVQVVITGPTPKTFAVDVSGTPGSVQADGTVSINLGTTSGLASGQYSVTISGVSTDGAITCTGSAAAFTVSAGATASVTAFASCRTAGVDAGSVTIGANFSSCGTVTSIADNIGEVVVGSTITVSGTSTGPDPGALTWSFAATPALGTFAPSSGSGGSPSTTFTCTSVGTVNIALTVADGTVPAGAPSCSNVDTKSITVVCDCSDSASSATSTSSSSSTPATSNVHCAVHNSGRPCTPTELLFIEKDTNPNTGAPLGSGVAFGCYDCLVNAGCLDDTDFPQDIDHECGDIGCGINQPTLSGDSPSASCLAVVSCALGGNCATALGSGNCYCGTAFGSNCISTGAPNGPCLAQEQDGLDSTVPLTINERFTTTAFAGGMANAIFSCAGTNGCTQCFP